MAKFLGIDYGLERTGLAISDPEGKLAFPLATLRLGDYGTRKALLGALANLALENSVDAVVMGLPLHGDGSESEISIQFRRAGEKIRAGIGRPFYWMPEFLSSESARMDLRAAGLRGKRLKAALDQQAACAILASFLALPEESRVPA